jgi:hypothetical protein
VNLFPRIFKLRTSPTQRLREFTCDRLVSRGYRTCDKLVRVCSYTPPIVSTPTQIRPFPTSGQDAVFTLLPSARRLARPAFYSPSISAPANRRAPVLLHLFLFSFFTTSSLNSNSNSSIADHYGSPRSLRLPQQPFPPKHLLRKSLSVRLPHQREE